MLKRIPPPDIRLGMYIHKLDGSWISHGFWRSSFKLERQEDLQQLRGSTLSAIWIDTEKGLDVQLAAPRPDAARVSPALPVRSSRSPRTEMKVEMTRALKLCARSKAAVIEMFSDLRMGRAVELTQVVSLVDEICASVLRHPNALISLARLKKADEYTYMHSVAVCGLMISLAHQLDFSPDMVHEAGMAGLFHDVGKMAISEQILNKAGALSDEEFDIVRSHPEEGGKMLIGSRHVSALVLDVCLHHHEKCDGSGYPHHLVQDQISLFAQMSAVCDVYDAVTSDRPYKKAWGPAEAIQRMAEWKGHFDERVFQAFVRCVGIYPVGTLVRLQSGRIGVVVEQHEKSLLTPVVKVFFSARSRLPIIQTIVNLADAGMDDKIAGRETADAWGLKGVDELWSGLAQQKKSHFD